MDGVIAISEHVVVAGAGIVGLAAAYHLGLRGHRVTVLDKEDRLAAHQTGHNSGVIHSGLYYAPGSLKATLGTRGAASMRQFAERHGIPVDICGKLVVATRPDQVPALLDLRARGRANGVPVTLISPAEAKAYEPHVNCVAALRVESTGIIDFVDVCRELARLIVEQDGEIRLRTEITGVDGRFDGIVVTTTTRAAGVPPTGKGGAVGSEAIGRSAELAADRFVNCAGLHADRIAMLAGLRPEVRIVPFRGEYFELAQSAQELVRGLIYPVPDPTLPFLGVHLTRMIRGGVHAGPNAVLALAREGYTWRDVQRRDIADAVRWPGLWHLGRRYWRTGVVEVRRSMSRTRFLASLRELVPDLPDDCLVPAPSGVRAQALHRSGALVQDFHLERAIRQIHVLNAPSPAATASLEIGRRIADEVESG